MKPKVFLGILLIRVILYQIISPLKENMECNYNDGTRVDSKGNIIRRSQASCQEAGIITNSNNIEETKSKLSELVRIADSVKIKVNKNTSSIISNLKNAITLGNAVSSEQEEGGNEGAHCDKHPEACRDQKPYPKVSKKQVMKAMGK